MSDPRKMLGVGIVGNVVAALCCFTSMLVVPLAAIGLAAVIGYLDYVLLPALAAFAGLTIYALWRYRKSCSVACSEDSPRETAK